jgi:uncharacterized membrane protein YhdT
MDELELLKKDWSKKGQNYPRLTYNEIYNMILKKSSSIVKWIFIISLLEFAFWGIIAFLLKDTSAMERFESYEADDIILPLTILSYTILAYFFYRFFMNYRTISVTDSVKVLMDNILRTRRTVKQYVAFNLVVLLISMFVTMGIQFNRDEELIAMVDQASANGDVLKFYAVTILISLLFFIVLVLLVLGFYYLIYGLLLKRLNTNYRELKKLEV